MGIREIGEKMVKHNLQKTILEIIIQSKKKGFQFITNEQIENQLKVIDPDIKDVSRKVTYSLYLLRSKKPKWNEPKVVREQEGWTVDPLSVNVWR